MDEKHTDAEDRSRRAVGCVLAAAIGDALGHPTEFLSLEEIHAEYGNDGVQGYELFWTRDGRRFAPYTDDTQMSEAVLRSLLWGRENGLHLEATMTHMAFGFVRWLSFPQGGHREPGHACQSGAELLLEGTHWSEAGSPDARGCGSVMRAYPFGLVFRDDPETAECWAAEHSRLTHSHPGAIASCAGLAAAVAAVARGAGVETARHRMLRAAEARCQETATLLREADAAASGGADPVTTLDRLRGWIADEALAAAWYVFARHPHDPRRVILTGANTPGDSDSIASIAGALAGAHCGVDALPAPWVQDLERTDELRRLAASI